MSYIVHLQFTKILIGWASEELKKLFLIQLASFHSAMLYEFKEFFSDKILRLAFHKLLVDCLSQPKVKLVWQ